MSLVSILASLTMQENLSSPHHLKMLLVNMMTQVMTGIMIVKRNYSEALIQIKKISCSIDYAMPPHLNRVI